MFRIFLLLGAVNAFGAIALGAFGAHGLKGRLTPEALTIWQTAFTYHLAHALALVLAAILVQLGMAGAGAGSGWLFLGGILLFSGSLYLLAFSGLRWLGAITPLGGLAFLGGWALLALAAWRQG